MRRKSILGALIILIALAGPVHQRALSRPPVQSDPQPKVFIQIVCGLVVIGIGVVVVYEIHKTCKKLLNDKPENANTNNPPNQVEYITGPGTNAPFVINGKGMVLNDETTPCWDASAFGWIDCMCGLPVNDCEQFTLQSSTNLTQWREEYSVQSWASDGGTLMLYSKAGLPVLTNYVALGATNFVPLDLGPLVPKKFFRIAAQQ